jgi:pimeloyl-ACP methyl ester carboxylesterase
MSDETAMRAGGSLGSTARRTRFVEVGGARIHMAEWGTGSPVLLLHGNPDSGMMWEGVAQRLIGRFHCIAPDLPGFGQSEVPADFDPSLAGLALFVEAFRRAAGIVQPLDLVAHDFGGPFAFAWAVRHPDAVRRLAIINTVFFSDYGWHFWASLWRTPILGELSMALLNRILFTHEVKRGCGRRLDPAYLRRVWASVTPDMKRQVLRLYRANRPAAFLGWEEELLELTARKPSLVLWGDRDPYIPQRFAERFGAGEVAHMADVGHWPPVEAPTETAERILRFLGDPMAAAG